MNTMVARAFILATAVVAFSASTIAQEGYPLTGTWYGEYGTGAAKKDITIVMKWDGSKASGLMNPGPGSVPLKNVVLDIIPGKAGNRSLNNPEGTEAVPPSFNV